MEANSFGNNYNLKSSIAFFSRWWKLLTIVLIVGAGISVAASFMVTPRYKSTVTLFPTNSNRLSKAIIAERYSLDFMDYGIERDCEYAIQILSSQSMEDAVCERFNLMTHYGVSANDPHKLFKTHQIYRSNVNVRRTDYLGVEVSVLDVAPQWAADIANFIAAHYDTLTSHIHADRARDAYNVMVGVCHELEQDIHQLEDSLRVHPQHAASTQQLINFKTQELAEMQTRMSERKVDLEQQVSYKFWLDQATAADKKAYPKRMIIVLLGTLGALTIAILSLLLFAPKVSPNDEKN